MSSISGFSKEFWRTKEAIFCVDNFIRNTVIPELFIRFGSIPEIKMLLDDFFDDFPFKEGEEYYKALIAKYSPDWDYIYDNRMYIKEFRVIYHHKDYRACFYSFYILKIDATEVKEELQKIYSSYLERTKKGLHE